LKNSTSVGKTQIGQLKTAKADHHLSTIIKISNFQ
jgi:hypothetical protein